MRISAHELANRLLSLPDYPVIFDGLGQDLDLVMLPYTGTIYNPVETEVVVIEIERTDP